MLAQDVLDSVRLHSRDDQAAEVALDAYRGARQGSLRVRVFGSRIEVLANAASVADPTPVFSEVDRMSTFLRGLSPAYRDFFITQVATLVLVGRKPTTLFELVRVAALAYGLETFFEASKTKSDQCLSTTPSGGKKGSGVSFGKLSGETSLVCGRKDPIMAVPYYDLAD
jgi:hypothetical protein